LTVFSQNVTAGKDSITISKRVARQIADDIMRKDSLQSELTVCKLDNSLYQKNIVLKDSIISSKTSEIQILKVKDTLNQRVQVLQNEQKTNLSNTMEDLKKQLNRQKIKSTFMLTGSGLIIAALLYVIVK
jgi:phosphopentomutase